MERRNAIRHDLWVPVIVDGLREGIAVTHNASENGLLIVAASPMQVGARVTITFRYAPSLREKPLVLGARVVRSHPNHADPEGLWPFAMAVELDTPVPDLERLVEELSTSGDPTS